MTLHECPIYNLDPDTCNIILTLCLIVRDKMRWLGFTCSADIQLVCTAQIWPYSIPSYIAANAGCDSRAFTVGYSHLGPPSLFYPSLHGEPVTSTLALGADTRFVSSINGIALRMDSPGPATVVQGSVPGL